MFGIESLPGVKINSSRMIKAIKELKKIVMEKVELPCRAVHGCKDYDVVQFTIMAFSCI